MLHKILCASANPDMTDMLHKHLKEKGFDVRTAPDGRQAYDLAVKYNPDLIITDVSMPLMSGFEFCKAVKANAQMKDIPVIVYNATSSVEDSFLFLGVKDFLYDSIQWESLDAKVKNLLGRARDMHMSKTKMLFHCTRPEVMAKARALIEPVEQWTPVFVYTAQDLLAKARTFIPEVIILDLFMGDLAADDAVAQLKAVPDLGNTQVLTYYSPASTAQADSIAMQAKMIGIQYLKRATAEAGAKEYLGPFNPENFLGLLNAFRKDFMQ